MQIFLGLYEIKHFKDKYLNIYLVQKNYNSSLLKKFSGYLALQTKIAEIMLMWPNGRLARLATVTARECCWLRCSNVSILELFLSLYFDSISVFER